MEPDNNEVKPMPDIGTRPPMPAPRQDFIPDDTLENVPGVREELEISYEFIEGATRFPTTYLQQKDIGEKENPA
ncbi:hypothetical protein E2C01_052444 [Portunus trituberculatus]|uniref:Uncharacterized protein n=1 Tax=Portunus trituberculatus TaxID=210409 RepID=A0A5B7GLK8_PORTR|nr:hypothetical protein [Portunus trituberculatus]